MKVFLLGAGASKSYGKSPTKQRMPIATDFFQTFDSLAIRSNPWVLVEGLCGYLMEEKNISDPLDFLANGIDIEALHSEIEEVRDQRMRGSQDFLEYYHPYRAYNELVFLFASVLNEIQNGPVSETHLTLATSLATEDAVITFNWDTLMDRALASATKWRPDFGYGVKPLYVFSDGWREPVSCASPVAPRILKLHGSTNWITAYPVPNLETGDRSIVLSHELDPSALSVFEFSTKPYPCHAGRYMEGYEQYSYGYYPPNLDHYPGRSAPDGFLFVRLQPNVPWREKGASGKAGLASIPLLIPPVRNKSYEMFGSLFGNLWTQAEEILTLAEEIIVIGYSFPKTDLQSIDLFRRAFSKRKTMPKVTVLDPAPTRVVEKFRYDFGVDVNHLRIIPDYFSENFDIQRLLTSF